ncbi:methyltransferase domain-containing protein [Candidatus Poribacteria bacterium]|nr:methyltransferase domain-containing protein [Candidatus Poribacteria bacterium]
MCPYVLFMYIRDNIAKRKLELIREDIAEGNDYTQPWLDLDVEAYRLYREKKTKILPEPYCNDVVSRTVMNNINGKKVLCLAGGGGQQSAVFSLLGASVTVLDLTPEQLESDKRAARHYGYNVNTIQGDMRELSVLPESHYDLIYQPISTLFIPDLGELYREVVRVLKNGGLYFSDYAVPLLYMAEDKGWDGRGYVLRITEPYRRGAILETEDEKLNFSEGESFSEFHHLLSDIINGLIAEGLTIKGLWENPRPDNEFPVDNLIPGSEQHRDRYIPFGLSVIAYKE